MTTLYFIQRAGFLSLLAALSFNVVNAGPEALDVESQTNNSGQRVIQVTNGEITDAQQYPFLTAVMTGRSAAVSFESNSYEAFFFGASEPVEFSGSVVDCGLALSPCSVAADRVCAIVFDFPDESGALLTPTQQLENCRLGGGLGAIFRAGPERPLNLSIEPQHSFIPAVYLVTGDGHQAVRDSLASAGEFTVQVTPQLPQTILCGGTYLGANWVLTAAHCVVDRNTVQQRIVEPYELVVNVAAFDLRAEQPFIQSVTEIITNNYHTNGPWGVNDYALLRLESVPVRGTGIDLVSSAELESLAASAAPVVVLGWGSTSVREPLTPVNQSLSTTNFPLQAILNLHTVNECRNLWGDFFVRNNLDSLGLVIDQNHVCASNIEFQQDTCQGDSGGPLLVTNSQGEQKLAGITSFGLGCGSNQSVPGVYASVPSFAGWIGQITELPVEGGADRLSGSQNDIPQSLVNGGGGSWSPGALAMLLFSTGICFIVRIKRNTGFIRYLLTKYIF